MASIAEQTRVRLINEILMADTTQEVTALIHAAVKSMEKKQAGEFIGQFIEKSLNELENFNPMNKQAQQWSNIKTARIVFFRLQRQLNLIIG
jgi:hypothetical protein